MLSTYEQVLQNLEEALRQGHRQQVDLVGAMERTYAFLEENGHELDDQQVLSLRMLLAHAETQIGRYFGM